MCRSAIHPDRGQAPAPGCTSTGRLQSMPADRLRVEVRQDHDRELQSLGPVDAHDLHAARRLVVPDVSVSLPFSSSRRSWRHEVKYAPPARRPAVGRSPQRTIRFACRAAPPSMAPKMPRTWHRYRTCLPHQLARRQMSCARPRAAASSVAPGTRAVSGASSAQTAS